jgi:hypothetical protein
MNYSMALAFVLAAVTAPARSLFSTDSTVEMTLEAPLQELFDKGTADEKFAATGVLSYRDTATGAQVRLPDVEISVRGHTSKRETECPFPKLKIKFRNTAARDASIFAGSDGLRIGTHCGDSPDTERTPKFGRLANEKAPLREVFVYRLLDAMGVPTVKARAARITYTDTGTGGAPLVRNAMLLEDEDDAKQRLGGTREITSQQFTTARAQLAADDTARLAFAQAMIGNFDWCLRFYPTDTYRCDGELPVWNLTLFERPQGKPLPVMADFDLAGMVVGRHHWFDKVYFDGFVRSRSRVEIEVLSQVQRTRSLFSRAELDAARRYFLQRKPAAYSALAGSGLDPAGREVAREYLDAFFAALGDEAFYRPVITKPNTPVYSNAAKSQEACAPGDFALRGSPVTVIATEGDMAQVLLLDARWRWGWKPGSVCKAVTSGPVWIEKQVIGTEYPVNGPEVGG